MPISWKYERHLPPVLRPSRDKKIASAKWPPRFFVVFFDALTLGKLRRAPRALQTVFLSLFHPRITGQKSGAF
jgi:hypothetical protein